MVALLVENLADGMVCWSVVVLVDERVWKWVVVWVDDWVEN